MKTKVVLLYVLLGFVLFLAACNSSSYDFLEGDPGNDVFVTPEKIVAENGTFKINSPYSNVSIETEDKNTIEEGVKITLSEREPNNSELAYFDNFSNQLSANKNNTFARNAKVNDFCSLSRVYMLSAVKDLTSGEESKVSRLEKSIKITIPDSFNDFEKLYFAFRSSQEYDFSFIEVSNSSFIIDQNTSACRQANSIYVKTFNLDLVFTVLAIKNQSTTDDLDSIKSVTVSSGLANGNTTNIVICSQFIANNHSFNFNDYKTESELIFFTDSDKSNIFNSVKINGINSTPLFLDKKSSGVGHNIYSFSIRNYNASDIEVTGTIATYCFKIDFGDAEPDELPDTFVLKNNLVREKVNFAFTNKAPLAKLPKPLPVTYIIAKLVTPSVKTDVATDTAIELEFSDTVNEKATEHIALASGSELVSYSCVFNKNILVMTPEKPLAYNTAYSVDIAEAVIDTASNTILASASFKFTTIKNPVMPVPPVEPEPGPEPEPEPLPLITVSMITPENVLAASVSTSIVLDFSENIIWTDEYKKFISLKNDSSEAAWTSNFDGNKKLTVQPESPLAFNTDYTVEIAEGLTGTDSEQKVASGSFHFKTEHLVGSCSVTLAPEYTLNGLAKLDSAIFIDFTKAIQTRTEIENAITVNGGSSVAEISNKEWNEENTRLTLSLRSLAPDSVYTVKMSGSVKDYEGFDIAVFADFSFNTVPYAGDGSNASPFVVKDSNIEPVEGVLPLNEGIKIRVANIANIVDNPSFETAVISIIGTGDKVENCQTVYDSENGILEINVPDDYRWQADETLELKAEFDVIGSDGVHYSFVTEPCVYTTDSNGSGTPEDPFRIYNAEMLDNVRNNLHASYKLMANIDLSPENYESTTNSAENGWIPLGTGASEEDCFTGTFDGNGKVIHNMKVNNPALMFSGLFGVVKNAEIKDLTIAEDCSVSGQLFAAGVAGVCEFDPGLSISEEASLKIINCHNKASVSCNSSQMIACSAGILGLSLAKDTQISQCTNTGTVETTCSDSAMYNMASGIVGATVGNVQDCLNEGNITANGATNPDTLNSSTGVVGMLLGDDIVVKNCVNKGLITFENGEGTNVVAGVIGGSQISNISEISNCINYGNVVSNSSGEDVKTYLGGVFGANSDGCISVFKNCSNYGNIIVNSYDAQSWSLGGILGDVSFIVSLKDCHNFGDIIKNEDGIGPMDAGGLAASLASIHSIETCSNHGSIVVNGISFRVGGLIGVLGNHEEPNVYCVKNCYSNADIKFEKFDPFYSFYVGGLIGELCGDGVIEVKTCFASGNIEGEYSDGNNLASLIACCDGNTSRTEGPNKFYDCFGSPLNKINGVSISDDDSLFDYDYEAQLIENCYFINNGYKSTLSEQLWSTSWSDSDWNNPSIWNLSDSAYPTLVSEQALTGE